MTSRQAGRRVSAMRAVNKKRVRKGGSRQIKRAGKNEPLQPRERRQLLQLVVCGTIFVLLVAAKLLLPGKMASFNAKLAAAMEKNMDVQAVFSAVGGLLTDEADVGQAASEVYQAVFEPQEEEEAMETAATADFSQGPSIALLDLRNYRPEEERENQSEQQGTEDTEKAGTEAGEEGTEEKNEVSTLAYVLYSDENLPENVDMHQALLGFDYTSPVVGTLSSNFGYREHPLEGEERFHYGVDLAADTGQTICSFADGTVTAVGESSSYGKYCMIAHEGGYVTLYAHCSRILTSSGAEVKEGEKIAEVGQSGMATGPHLHFELQKDGIYFNPIYYVDLC